MNRVIRNGVFETNSSSSHSISITRGDFVADRLPVGDDGVCRIFPGEFGWEVDDHYDAATKASYALTFVKELAGSNGYGEFKNFATSDAQRCELMLHDVIMKQTGAKEVEFVHMGEGNYHTWGYIDHQSHAVCEKAFESAENLRAFIFNRESWLHTDNDNR